jgi:hypothetical protein
VIVGGTNYYIESLLWKVLVEEDESSLGIRKQVKSASNVEDTHSDIVNVGGTLKVHVGETIESLKKKRCNDNHDSAKLLDVTCQKEDLDKCSGAKCQERLLDCDTEIVSTKCKKRQRGDVGLHAFSSRYQANAHSKQLQTEVREVDCVRERPNLGSTECQKYLDHNAADVPQACGTVFSQKVGADQETCQEKGSEEDMDLGLDRPEPVVTEFKHKTSDGSDVGETQTKVHGESVGEDQTEEVNMLKEVCQDESMMNGADLSIVSNNVKIGHKTEGLVQIRSVGNEQEVCLDDKRQRVQADSELVYERDRRRMQEARSQEDLESKNLSVQGDLVDLLDEAALEHVPSSHLYEKLQAVDPDMAQGLHPNNKRKIIR